MKGKVYLVGAGPGSPELITLKGLKCLKKAQVVVHDRLAAPELLKHVPKTAKIIYAGKSSNGHALTQEQINKLLLKLAKHGKSVVRLKGGDPFLFGRGGEESEFLAGHNVDFEVVPGVTSAVAVPACAGIPLTHRRFASSIGIFTGHEADDKKVSSINWKKISTGLDTLVFLMGVENLFYIVKNLMKSGRPAATPCCLIQNGTLPHQKSVTANLGTIVKKAETAKIKPPSILVVGDVVSLQNRINRDRHKSLSGKKIIITASPETSLKFKKILEGYGAVCRDFSLIEIKPLKSYAGFDSCINKIDDFRWIIWTSRNAVRFFKQRCEHLNKNLNVLEKVKIAAIGPETKTCLEKMGLKVHVQPTEFCQEGLIESFKKIDIKDKNILIVCSPLARSKLSESLKKMGANVKVLFAYRTFLTDKKKKLLEFPEEKTDVITFTSSSCVKNFLKIFPGAAGILRKRKVLVASIGPITSNQAAGSGLKVDIQATDYTLNGLAMAIIKHYDKRHEVAL